MSLKKNGIYFFNIIVGVFDLISLVVLILMLIFNNYLTFDNAAINWSIGIYVLFLFLLIFCDVIYMIIDANPSRNKKLNVYNLILIVLLGIFIGLIIYCCEYYCEIELLL